MSESESLTRFEIERLVEEFDKRGKKKWYNVIFRCFTQSQSQ